MSHIVEAKTQIEDPDQSLLRQTVEIVASQHAGGEVRNYYLSYEGQQQQADLAIATATVFRGMAIEVKDKKLTFVGDAWGYGYSSQQLQQQIVQTYVSLATMQALQALGYQVAVEDGESGQVIVQGVTYA